MIESFLVLIEPNTGLMELKGLKIGAGTFFRYRIGIYEWF